MLLLTLLVQSTLKVIQLRTLQLVCTWPSFYTVLLFIEKDSQAQANCKFVMKGINVV